MLYLLNFSHPVTDEQLTQIKKIIGAEQMEVVDVSTHFDNDMPFEPQLQALMAGLPISGRQLQTEQILIIPPALNFITAMVLAELHGRMGYFPPMVRIRSIANSLPPRYEVAEIVNLQRLRAEARKRRGNDE